jgi:hypothetical protein
VQFCMHLPYRSVSSVTNSSHTLWFGRHSNILSSELIMALLTVHFSPFCSYFLSRVSMYYRFSEAQFVSASFRVATPCGVAGRYRRFGEIYCFDLRVYFFQLSFKLMSVLPSSCRWYFVVCLGNVTGRPGFDPRQRQRIFPLISASRPALGPIQPPVQWVLGIFHGDKCGRGVLPTTHPLLMPWDKKGRGYTSSPSVRHKWRITGNL